MRDLKHIYYFEKLLENSYNELIGEAQGQGRKAIGHVCYQIPEPLLNLPGIFSVRLRAPRTTSTEMGNYYLTPIFCEACRAWSAPWKAGSISSTGSSPRKPAR